MKIKLKELKKEELKELEKRLLKQLEENIIIEDEINILKQLETFYKFTKNKKELEIIEKQIENKIEFLLED